MEEFEMELWELFMIAVGLAMDAFAVSICKGLSVPQLKYRHCLIAGLYFGGFQGLMPLAGYMLGTGFSDMIERIDHWIAFFLLGFIGLNMIKESRECCEDDLDASFTFKAMLPLAIATSIDALAVGVTFAFLKVDIIAAVTFIGVITFMLSAFGVKLGNVVGCKYKSKAELAGGIVLIAMGTKILLEHLGFLG